MKNTTLRLSVLFWILLLGIPVLKADEVPTITPADGAQEFCLTGPQFVLEVAINVEECFTDPIDFFEIKIDNVVVMEIPGSSNPPNQFLDLDFENFFGNCLYSTGKSVFLCTHLEDGTTLNNGFFATFINPPIAEFSFNSTVCVGTETCFTNTSCPNTPLATFMYDYGDEGMGADNCYIYTDTGTYQVTLSMEVPVCDGVSSVTHTIQVIEAPTATAVIQGELPSNDTIFICSGEEVQLDGSLYSENESSYSWSVLGNPSVIWSEEEQNNPPINPIFTDNPILQINSDGTVFVVLSVNNICDVPALDTLVFQVTDGEALTLEDQENACVSLNYTPIPYFSSAIYTINGEVVSEFPITLLPNDNDYTVTASDPTNSCADGELEISFTVFAEEQAQILQNDTTYCSTDGTITLMGAPENSNWMLNNDPFNGILDLGMAEEQNVITYGEAPCIALDTLIINVLQVGITITPQPPLCVDGETENITATPTGGTFSGTGITDAINGTFDPAVAGVGSHWIYYEIQHPSEATCSAIDSTLVEVVFVEVAFEIDTCMGTTFCFDTINTTPFTSILYDFEIATSNQISPCQDFEVGTNYDVTVTIMQSGCESSYTETVAIEPPPIADFTLTYNTPPCADLEMIFTNMSQHGTIFLWDFGNGETSDLENPPPITYLAPCVDTTYTITLTVRNSCSISVFTQTIDVLARPQALFGVNLNEFCSGDTAILSNNSKAGTSYRWYKNDELISTDSMPPIVTHITETIDTIEICLIVENMCAIDTLCEEVVFMPTDIVAHFNTETDHPCVNSSACFTNFSNSNIVEWDFGDGTFSNELNPCHIYTQPGVYTVLLKAFGCGYDEFITTIEVFAIPTAVPDFEQFACPNTAIVFAENSIDASGYLWNFGDSTTATNSIVTHSFPVADTTYEVCLTVTSQNGCTHTVCEPMTTHPLPPTGFSFPDSLCAGDVIQITNLSGNNTSFFYDFGNGNFDNSPNPTTTYLESGNYVITQYTENGDSCESSLSLPIYIRSLPEPAFDFIYADTCHPVVVEFVNLSENAESYEWNFGDGALPSTMTNPTHTYNEAGEYEVTLQAWKDGICTAFFSQIITIHETPLADVNFSATALCAETEWTFNTDMNIFGSTFFWDFGDSTVSYEASGTHIFATAGTYEGFLIETLGACADTTFFTTQVYGAVDFEADSMNLICDEEPTGGIILTPIAGAAPFDYNWSNGEEIPALNDLAAGTYSVTIIDQNECTWEEDFTLTQPDPISATVTEVQTVTCFGDVDGAIEIGIVGGIPNYNLLWETGATTNSLSQMPAGIYELTITDANGCELLTEWEIPTNELIAPTFTAKDLVCFGETDGLIIIDNIEGGVAPFLTTLSGKDYNKTGELHDNLAPDTYTLHVLDALGCEEELEISILEHDSIGVQIDLDALDIRRGVYPAPDTILLGQELNVKIDHNFNATLIEWESSDDNFNCNACLSSFTSPDLHAQYFVLLEDEHGCIVQDTAAIYVEEERNIALPNTFTPNGDGFNDVFMPRNSLPSLDEILTFQIYDKWGEMIFEQYNFQPNLEAHGWNGSFRGEELPPDKYIYVLKARFVDDEEKVLSGDVLLVR